MLSVFLYHSVTKLQRKGRPGVVASAVGKLLGQSQPMRKTLFLNLDGTALLPGEDPWACGFGFMPRMARGPRESSWSPGVTETLKVGQTQSPELG